MRRFRRLTLLLLLCAVAPALPELPLAHGGVTVAEVERAIREGVRFLKSQQREDGSWSETDNIRGGTSALATLALLSAGVCATDPTVRSALGYLERFNAASLGKTYGVALQTVVFARVDPDLYRTQLRENVRWLELAQIKPSDQVPWPGSWTYSDRKAAQGGDNSNTEFALLGLNAASDVGIPVHAEVWKLSLRYWESAQIKRGRELGSWTYRRDTNSPSAAMTGAGIAALAICGTWFDPGHDILAGAFVKNCEQRKNRPLQAGLAWLSSRFSVSEDAGTGQKWKFYYLHDLALVGRMTGVRYLGAHDWYAEGAEHLVRNADRFSGRWTGTLIESDRVVATSFALMFLAEGRSPVLINKARHDPEDDWNRDPNDIRNLVDRVSSDWKSPLAWQSVDLDTASVDDLRRAPILFLNGHKAPEVSAFSQNTDSPIRRRRRNDPRRRMLFQPGIRRGVPKIDPGDLPRARLRSACLARRPRHLDCTSPTEVR